MLLPLLLLIPLGVGVAATASGIAALVTSKKGKAKAEPQLPAELDGKKVAILGAQRVGKTTLLRFLEAGKLPTKPAPTVDPTPGGQFEMNVNGVRVAFDVPEDVPGNGGLQFKDWQRAVDGADYVWYLFHSDLMADTYQPTAHEVRKHVMLLQQWIASGVGPRPKVILIGTHADGHGAYAENPLVVDADARDADPIKVAMVQLDAVTVTGSLRTNDEARVLVNRLKGYL